MLCDRALRLTFVLSGLLLCAKCCFPVIPVEDCTCDQDIESTFTRLDPSDGVAAVLSYSVGKVPATGCSIATVTCDSSTAHPGKAELIMGTASTNAIYEFQPEVVTVNLVCDAGNWAVDGDPAQPVNEIRCSSRCCFPATDYVDGSTTTVTSTVIDPVSGCEASAVVTCSSPGPASLMGFISVPDVPGSVDGNTCDPSPSVQATMVCKITGDDSYSVISYAYEPTNTAIETITCDPVASC